MCIRDSTPGSWPPSSTPSSSRGPRGRRRSSATLWAPPRACVPSARTSWRKRARRPRRAPRALRTPGRHPLALAGGAGDGRRRQGLRPRRRPRGLRGRERRAHRRRLREPHRAPAGARSDGETILGADDKAAVAALLLLLRDLALEPPAADVEFVFTAGEEIGLQGAKALDPASVAAAAVFVFDSEGEPGTMIAAAPTLKAIAAEFRGED